MMKIFIGNLSWGTKEDAIRELCEQYGEVEQVRLITDRETGRSRGFAFASYANRDDALNAIEQMNGMEFDGRNLNVNEARERQPRPANVW
ncbi:RNA recognition motif domain-containing protein [Acanthopleuribacter pedis]|uniref:RNA-binding protein n=1 Tax=Acanthopleuribacter pedis TaxID=442870 RepID=A0A8J7U5R8_9BACT|nr:RNA-binding protein [Acanthopleuribacter pedis]MBO1319596.1 RNA-binding protein [Acanthopleuribacter pedis]